MTLSKRVCWEFVLKLLLAGLARESETHSLKTDGVANVI
jgi:hypothetical protein